MSCSQRSTVQTFETLLKAMYILAEIESQQYINYKQLHFTFKHRRFEHYSLFSWSRDFFPPLVFFSFYCVLHSVVVVIWQWLIIYIEEHRNETDHFIRWKHTYFIHLFPHFNTLLLIYQRSFTMKLYIFRMNGRVAHKHTKDVYGRWNSLQLAFFCLFYKLSFLELFYGLLKWTAFHFVRRFVNRFVVYSPLLWTRMRPLNKLESHERKVIVFHFASLLFLLLVLLFSSLWRICHIPSSNHAFVE